MIKENNMPKEKYGRVNFTTIYKLKNELREAIHEEGTERIQELWDRMERWIESPPMNQRKRNDLPDVTIYLLLLSMVVSLVWTGIDYVKTLRKNLRRRR
jgi:hypothetical protein